jgi:transposase
VIYTRKAITQKEESLLVNYYKRGPNTLMRARAQAILMSTEKLSVGSIARIVRYEEQTIRGWITAWEETRMSSIFVYYAGNENASKLTRTQKDEIRETLEKPDGLPFEFLSLPALKEHISTTFGVVYESDQSYYYLLHHCGFSWKLPSPFDRRRNDELVKERMTAIRRAIKPLLKKPDCMVFAADESRINYDEEIRRCWLQRNKKTVIRIERDKSKSQNYFGALNLTTHAHELIPLTWQDTENTIEALRELTRRYPQQKLYIIWDNAQWHRSKALRALFGTDKEFSHIHCIWLPPYAPDENPEEHVWKHGKESIRSKHFTSFDELRDQFEDALTSRMFEYKI